MDDQKSPKLKEKLQQKHKIKSNTFYGQIRFIPQFYGSSLSNFKPCMKTIDKAENKCIVYLFGEEKNGLREMMKYTIFGPWDSLPQIKKMSDAYNDTLKLRKRGSLDTEEYLRKSMKVNYDNALEKEKGSDLNDVNAYFIESMRKDLSKVTDQINLSNIFGKNETTKSKVLSKLVSISMEMDAAITELLQTIECPCGNFISGLELGKSVSCFSIDKKFCSFSCQEVHKLKY